MQTLIRCRGLRNLIWVYTVCLLRSFDQIDPPPLAEIILDPPLRSHLYPKVVIRSMGKGARIAKANNDGPDQPSRSLKGSFDYAYRIILYATQEKGPMQFTVNASLDQPAHSRRLI